MSSVAAKKQTEDNEDVVLVLPRGSKGEVRLSLSRYRGKDYVRFHLWYPTSNPGEMAPGRQITTLHANELDQVIESLKQLRDRMVG